MGDGGTGDGGGEKIFENIFPSCHFLDDIHWLVRNGSAMVRWICSAIGRFAVPNYVQKYQCLI